MKTLVLLVGLAGMFILNSCATIVSGTSQEVSVSTTPRARIEIKADSGLVYYSGDTPAIIKLPRKYSYTVTIQAAGYQQKTMIISKQFNAWFVGNILFGGIPGGVVDAITGAMWNLEPSIIAISLESASTRTDKGIEIVIRSCDSPTKNELRIPVKNLM